MKFKKILSSVVAAAMAVTTFSAFSTTATAAEATNTIWTGTHEVTWSTGMGELTKSSFVGYSGDVTLTITVTDLGANPQVKIGYNEGGTWDWKESSIYSITSETYDIAVDEELLTALQAAESIQVQGNDFTLTKVELTGEYEEVTTDIWIDNGDGSYTLERGTASSVPSLALTNNYNNLISISLDVSFEGVTGDANGCVGVSLYNDGLEEWGTWNQKTWDQSTTSMEWTFGDTLMGNPAFQVWTLEEGAKVTVSNIQTLETNKGYSQESSDGTAVRGVMLISEELALNTDAVKFTFSNGSKSVDVESTKYYNTVSAAGDTITAPDGYVFVAYAITGIPSGTTVECTGIVLE